MNRVPRRTHQKIGMSNLLNYRTISALAFIAVALALVAAYREYTFRDLVDYARIESDVLTQTLSNSLWPQFGDYVRTANGLGVDELKAGAKHKALHAEVVRLTHHFAVLKVKIYDAKGLTVYSSDPGQIGESKSGNAAFTKVIETGEPTSSHSHRKSFTAFSHERFNVDVVETYVPVRAGDGTLDAVFEIYLDVTPVMARSNNGTIVFGGTTAGVLLFLYIVLIFVQSRSRQILEAEIESRKRIESALISANDRFHKAFYASPSIVAISAADGKLYDVNDRWVETFGYSRDEAIGKSAVDLGTWVEPADRDKAIAAHSPEGLLENFEARFRARDGRIIYGLHSSEHIEIDGQSMRIGIMNDITERKRVEEALKESEERFKSIIENSPAAIFLKDLEGRFMTTSSTFKEWYRIFRYRGNRSDVARCSSQAVCRHCRGVRRPYASNRRTV